MGDLGTSPATQGHLGGEHRDLTRAVSIIFERITTSIDILRPSARLIAQQMTMLPAPVRLHYPRIHVRKERRRFYAVGNARTTTTQPPSHHSTVQDAVLDVALIGEDRTLA